MSNVREALITDDIDAYLDQHRHKSLLRFITCGSVDDGKSTLIGRLLYESQLIFDDQLAALQRDSQKIGTQDGEIDFALLVDGLAAEREQGITIDVAYRFFTTEHRKFIVADTPGHEQYTRNMVTGASTADAAVILIDARRGVLTQTRRHTFLVSLLGIDRIVLAVNKLDLVDYDRARFDEIVDDYKTFAAGLGLDDVSAIPLSALRGDNIVSPSARTPWYDGPTLLKTLETLPVEERASLSPFRMSVQRVNRPDLDFRGFSGMIAGGTVRPGDDVSVLPSGRTSRIERISTFDGDLGLASAGQSVTLVLQDEIDVSRGDLICSTDDPVSTVDEVEAMVVWMHDEELVPDRRYAIKLGSRTANGSISRPHYKVDVNTLEHHGADSLELNEIGRCTVTMDRPVTIDSYVENRDTGGFLIIDRTTNATVGCGMVTSGTRRRDVEWQDLDITARRRADLKGHGPGIIWFTGLSGAGKSTIANRTERLLHSLGMHTYLLDGDNVRQGLNRDLSFTEDDRVENVRRVAEVANLMADAGLVVLVSFISPFRAEREFARDIAGAGRFCEVYVDTPLEVAERRDPKGLYRRARAGEIDDFTGIDSPYEAPNAPDVHIDTTSTTPEQGASQVIQELRRLGVLPS